MNPRSLWNGIVAAAALAATGCATTGSTPEPRTEPPPAAAPAAAAGSATATLESRSGSPVTGTARFTQTADGVQAEIEIAGASEGLHGLHLHEKGDCSAPDAASAGAHWNPTGDPHGDLHAPAHHAGDLGNITIGADGTGKATVVNPAWSIGPVEGKHDVVGKAVIFHASPDDLQSQPAGNAGPRQACGVIQAP